MKVVPVSGEIALIAVHQLEGQYVLEVPCQDFDEYKALPDVVKYQRVNCVKTGWSSDTGRACYKSGVPTATVV